MNKHKTNTDCVIEDSRWHELDFDIEQLINNLVELTLNFVNFYDYAESSRTTIKFTNDKEITNLNSNFRNRNKETNVLSFPIQNLKNGDFTLHNFVGEVYLGDIAISFDTVIREVQDQDKTFEDHLTHLIIHSMLHLLGYDHVLDEEASIMEDIEIKILKELNIKNPYLIIN